MCIGALSVIVVNSIPYATPLGRSLAGISLNFSKVSINRIK